MKVMFINNAGAGFADYVDVEPGSTIEKFLAEQVRDYKPGDLLIRVNRLPVARDTVLQEGDRISATPVKIQGAKTRPAVRRNLRTCKRPRLRKCGLLRWRTHALKRAA